MNRYLGIDYGERRVGFAVSDPSGIIAIPLRAERVRSAEEALSAVVAVCAETGAQELVIGLPVNMNGTHGPMAAKVKAFAEEAGRRVGIPVRLWDERLSTGLVERVLLEADMSRRRRKDVRDKLAAQVILQGYLDAQAEAARTADDGREQEDAEGTFADGE